MSRTRTQTSKGLSERDAAQRQLDDCQVLLDLEQAADDQEARRLDYQQADADIGRLRMVRESEESPAHDESFGLEKSVRNYRQGTGDAQVLANGRQQDRTDQAQAAHDHAQWRHDETATPSQTAAEEGARIQRTRAVEAQERRARDQARDATEQARRHRSLL